MRRLSVQGGKNKVFELTGSGTADPEHARAGHDANMIAELGATSAVFAPDANTREWLRRQHGILALTFEDESDYERTEAGQAWSLPNVRSELERGPAAPGHPGGLDGGRGSVVRALIPDPDRRLRPLAAVRLAGVLGTAARRSKHSPGWEAGGKPVPCQRVLYA